MCLIVSGLGSGTGDGPLGSGAHLAGTVTPGRGTDTGRPRLLPYHQTALHRPTGPRGARGMSLLVQAPVWGAQHTAFDAQPPHQQSTVAMASGWDGRHGHSQLAACHSRAEPHAARGQWGVLGRWHGVEASVAPGGRASGAARHVGGCSPGGLGRHAGCHGHGSTETRHRQMTSLWSISPTPLQ